MRFGVEIFVGTTALGRQKPFPERPQLVLTSGTVVRTRAAVVAMGVFWRRLHAPGVEDFVGRGVTYGAAPGEALGLTRKTMALVGGANSAGQAALHFAEHAERVFLLVRASSLDAGMSRYLVERVLAHPRIEVRTGTKVLGAMGGARLGHWRWPRRAGKRSICLSMRSPSSSEERRSPVLSRAGCDATSAAT